MRTLPGTYGEPDVLLWAEADGTILEITASTEGQPLDLIGIAESLTG